MFRSNKSRPKSVWTTRERRRSARFGLVARGRLVVPSANFPPLIKPLQLTELCELTPRDGAVELVLWSRGLNLVRPPLVWPSVRTTKLVLIWKLFPPLIESLQSLGQLTASRPHGELLRRPFVWALASTSCWCGELRGSVQGCCLRVCCSWCRFAWWPTWEHSSAFSASSLAICPRQRSAAAAASLGNPNVSRSSVELSR